VPLDPIDFAGDPAQPDSAWPFGPERIQPYYVRAQGVCGLGPFRYDAAAWATPTTALLSGGPFDSKVYQFGTARWFTETYPAQLQGSSGVALHAGAIVRRLVMRDGHVTAVEGVAAGGAPFLLRPRATVLAAGAIGNARLLLCSGDTPASAPGNQGGWLGRGFMEHPRDRSLRLTPPCDDVAARLAFYDRHVATDGTVIAGRLTPAEDWLAREGLPNFSLSFAPDRRPSRLPWWIRARLQRFGWRAPPTGFGWTAGPTARGRPRLRALLHLEQRPHRDNRVQLDSARDRFGIPLPVLDWRWRESDDARLTRVRAAARRWLDATGLFETELVPHPLDPNAFHHAGTTRFHLDPRLGVTDPDGRVHGTDNLYAAGVSLFPACGVANPTLTIVALAIRLADHVRMVLGASGDGGPDSSAAMRRSRSR
jgi:choline dehydrogenase-like flavoprotein